MLCRLCSKNSDNVFHFFDTEGLRMEIVSIVAKHFWFEPKPEDTSSHLICDLCWMTTKNFHELYLLVEKVEKDWAKNLCLIKEDPSNSITDYDDLYHDDDDVEDEDADFKKNNAVNQSVEQKIFDSKVNEAQSSFDQETKLEINEDCNSEKCDPIISSVPKKEKSVKSNTRKRGRPVSTNKSNKNIRKSKRNLKKTVNDSEDSNDDYESNGPVKEIKKKKERKQRLQKRTPEETAEYNKKVAEGDDLIAKFMKIICNFCSEEQKNFTSFKHHCTSAHGQEGVITCCEKKFYRKSKLVEHVERHLEPDKHKCHICGHVSVTRRNLKLHMNNKHAQEEQIKPYNCTYCGKAFKLNAVRLRHELIHMPEEEKKFKCPQCDKNFPAEQSLKYHIRAVHDGHYAGVCDICGKAYNNRGELKRHRLQTHEGVESYRFKCKYCGQEFMSKYTYNVHKFREHENTNPDVDHKCPMCDKTSKNINAIKKHIQYVHKAKAKFECNLCSKVFKFELALKEHTASHVGQPLYSCPHCPRTFTHNSNMHHHRKLKHPVEFELARQMKKDKKETWREITALNL